MDTLMIVTKNGIPYYQPQPDEYDIPLEVIHRKLESQGYKLSFYDPTERMFVLEKIQ